MCGWPQGEWMRTYALQLGFAPDGVAPPCVRASTDATIAEHIKKVIERSYVEKRNGTHFYPTLVGRTLLKGYVDVGFDLGKPEQRAEMERVLNRVASGEVNITKLNVIGERQRFGLRVLELGFNVRSLAGCMRMAC